jgi:hypothetical protein
MSAQILAFPSKTRRLVFGIKPKAEGAACPYCRGVKDERHLVYGCGAATFNTFNNGENK